MLSSSGHFTLPCEARQIWYCLPRAQLCFVCWCVCPKVQYTLARSSYPACFAYEIFYHFYPSKRIISPCFVRVAVFGCLLPIIMSGIVPLLLSHSCREIGYGTVLLQVCLIARDFVFGLHHNRGGSKDDHIYVV